MSKLYINISNAPVSFLINEGGVESFKDIHIGDKIIVNGEEISFPNSAATIETKFSDAEKYFKRYRTQEENKEMNEFKKNAAIAATQALIRRQDDTANDILQVNDTLIAISVNWSNIVQYIHPDGTDIAATQNIQNNLLG